MIVKASESGIANQIPDTQELRQQNKTRNKENKSHATKQKS